MTYKEKLLDPRWQKRRLDILNRDGWQCTECPEKNDTLHIHHKWYEHGRDPWDYDDEVLCTLCKGCHEFEEILKVQNPQIYDHAKSANLTCLRLWKWNAAITFLAKYHPDQYKSFVDFGNDVIMRHHDALWKHSSRPNIDVYGEAIH